MESIVNTVLIAIASVISGAFFAFVVLLFRDATKKNKEPKKKVLFTKEGVSKTPLPEYESTY
jgi:hypothetical protein